MKTRILTIITLTTMLGACASQGACGNEREYRNQYLRAKRIAAPADATAKGDPSCSTQIQTTQ